MSESSVAPAAVVPAAVTPGNSTPIIPPAPIAADIPPPPAKTVMQAMQEKLFAARMQVVRLEQEVADIPAHMHNLTIDEVKSSMALAAAKVDEWFEE